MGRKEQIVNYHLILRHTVKTRYRNMLVIHFLVLFPNLRNV